MTLNEFNQWLSGVEDMQEDGWCPDPKQWSKIRQKLNEVVKDLTSAGDDPLDGIRDMLHDIKAGLTKIAVTPSHPLPQMPQQYPGTQWPNPTVYAQPSLMPRTTYTDGTGAGGTIKPPPANGDVSGAFSDNGSFL